MIPHKSDSTITIGGVDNATQFSIATSGKAFKILIDGLYSDKVLAPVRELITNAVDAHVAAGNPDVPFKVTVPTNIDPTFGVRDYGTGMDHETIVGLYTTLFASSKDTTNDQTGMLGLGSKSPFAYTDAFTVEAFDGVSKRVYMAYTEDDVPSLSLVGEVETDEPRGISVQFPVQINHRVEFTEAIFKVLAGLDVIPELDGVEIEEIDLPTVVMEGSFLYQGNYNGWRLVKSPHLDTGTTFLRQGGVIYPLSRSVISGTVLPLTYSSRSSLVIDAPIGTAEVTPSRESLSYDAQTTANIKALCELVWANIQKVVDESFKKCTSQYEYVQWAEATPKFITDAQELKDRYPSLILRGRYDLMPSHFKMQQQWTGEEMKQQQDDFKHLYPTKIKNGDMMHQIDGDDAPHLLFVLDDGVSPRRRSRMLDWAASGYHGRRLMIAAGPEQQAVVKRLKALMHLTDEQFIPVADIDDPGPKSVAPRSTTKKSELVTLLESGVLWAERDRVEIKLRRSDGGLFWDGRLDNKSYDFPTETFGDVLFLTPHQIKTLAPSWDQSLAKRVLEMAWEILPQMTSSTHSWNVQSTLNDAACSYSQELAKHLGYFTQNIEATPPVTRVARQAVPQFTNYAMLVETCKKKYPALFPQKLDADGLKDYLDMQDEDPTNENIYA